MTIRPPGPHRRGTPPAASNSVRGYTSVDLDALHDLVRFGVMAEDQIIRRYRDAKIGPYRIRRLKTAGLVSEWGDTLEGSSVFSPTPLARHVIGRHDLNPHTTRRTHLAHDVAVVDLADYLLRFDPSHKWITEDELRTFLDKVAPPPQRMPGDTRHQPDGLLLVQEERIAIELERSDKGPDRYRQISRWFVCETRIHRVRWYVDSPGIIERLRQLNALHGFDRDIDIAIEPLPPEVRIRHMPGKFRT
jgi:hypothetical protein